MARCWLDVKHGDDLSLCVIELFLTHCVAWKARRKYSAGVSLHVCKGGEEKLSKELISYQSIHPHQ